MECLPLRARLPAHTARLSFFLMCLWYLHGVFAHNLDDPIVLTEASGFHRCIAEEEMAFLFKENLSPDFKPWQGKTYRVRQLYELLDVLVKGRPQKYLSLVLIRRGKVTFLPLAAKPMALTMSRMRAIAEGLRNATRKGLAIPDTCYLMNVWDEGRCYPDGDPRLGDGRAPRCTVPVFSLIKSWDYAAMTSSEMDVLLPFFNHVYGNLVFFPWEKKKDKALMRAAMQAQMRPNSTRLWIIQLQHNNPVGQRLLDAGITNNLSRRKDIKLADFVPIPEHARWKYLLSADGFTASCRLGKLLGTNSVVLKETTPWIEYYYRSLRPDVHFVPFTKDNVLEVLTSLEADQGRCQRISADAQQFSFTFLGQYSKAMYVKRALLIYNSLFSDMESFMEWLNLRVSPEGEGESGDGGGGMTLVGLMELMRKYIDKR